MYVCMFVTDTFGLIFFYLLVLNPYIYYLLNHLKNVYKYLKVNEFRITTKKYYYFLNATKKSGVVTIAREG